MTAEKTGAMIRAEAPPWPLLSIFGRTRGAGKSRVSDACGFTITREMLPAFDELAAAGVKSASALADIGGAVSRFWRRAPRGWRRHVRRLKASGRTVPLLGLRRWSQRGAQRERRRKMAAAFSAVREMMRRQIDRNILFGPGL